MCLLSGFGGRANMPIAFGLSNNRSLKSRGASPAVPSLTPRQAADCDELARNAPDEKQREQIKNIAETWRKLAAERERWLKST